MIVRLLRAALWLVYLAMVTAGCVELEWSPLRRVPNERILAYTLFIDPINGLQGYNTQSLGQTWSNSVNGG
ncbi:hypothetical protein L1987_20325 [Smallanthus sonchifolius]|uniref:Uncharacterized protein n=1 Tax=Smallanthus sonchifolius TaxID=185202 RepID=A0ACB9ISQ2_9ASTR|nr:hypothetical protein L1987_20325 [Smallanthus sonchifolius]